jgi:hypothetical protein
MSISWSVPTMRAVHEALIALGYERVHQSEDAANYVRGDEALDLHYAHRPTARRLLERAGASATALGRLRVVSAEGLIGFKLQAMVNAPERGRDRDDILALLRAGRGKLDMQEIRSYFELFDRKELLDELIEEARDTP